MHLSSNVQRDPDFLAGVSGILCPYLGDGVYGGTSDEGLTWGISGEVVSWGISGEVGTALAGSPALTMMRDARTKALPKCMLD